MRSPERLRIGFAQIVHALTSGGELQMRDMVLLVRGPVRGDELMERDVENRLRLLAAYARA